jgi:tetratricopeptide (TPR) repeat protein
MSITSEANPYSPASLSGRASNKATTTIRRLRIGMRQSRSVEDLNSISQAISEEKKTSGIYILKMEGVPCGCDHDSMEDLEREISRKKDLCRTSKKPPYQFRDGFYTDLEALYFSNNHTELSRWLAFWDDVQKSGHYQGENAWLELEAVLTQILLYLGRFDEALIRADQALQIFPHDDFLLYAKAQALIERSPGFLIFGPNKEHDLKEAQDILLKFGEANQDVPLFQSKHDFVWALWHKVAASQLGRNSQEVSQYERIASACALKVPPRSIYKPRAEKICPQACEYNALNTIRGHVKA